MVRAGFFADVLRTRQHGGDFGEFFGDEKLRGFGEFYLADSAATYGRRTHFLVALFLLDDVNASLSGRTRFVLNNDTNPTNQPINSSGDDRNVATARYESQDVILAGSDPMAPERATQQKQYDFD